MDAESAAPAGATGARASDPISAGTADTDALCALDAAQALAHLVAGTLSAAAYADALLARSAALEPLLRAWTCLDPALVRAQAAAADAAHRAGGALGALHGLPVGLKDVIDTASMPTENGSVLHAGRRPAADAVLVQRLRRAGAVVMGKTVTTELATYASGPTRNPHDPCRTPGGSSSGSAAAVAAGMLPLAVGTQTNGSVIRPAAFCGVVGYKPSAGLIPRTGVLVQSPSFDAVGVFARTVVDAALLAEAIAGDDGCDPLARGRAAPPLARVAGAPPPRAPVIAWNGQPAWGRVAADARAAFEALAARMGWPALALPAGCEEACEHHRVVMEAEIAGSFEALWRDGAARMSAPLQGQIERGLQVTAVRWRRGTEAALALRAAFDRWFDTQGMDAWATPSALGTAPAGLASTGDPVMCTLASFAGLPAVGLPLLRGADGMPLGLQLVGRHGDDARLLRTANWLMDAAGGGAQRAGMRGAQGSGRGCGAVTMRRS